MKIKALAIIGEKAMTKLGPLGATLAKKSPQIFMWTGIGSIVAGEVLTGFLRSIRNRFAKQHSQ